RRGDKDMPVGGGRLDRVGQGLVEGIAAPTVVRDRGAVVDGVVDRADGAVQGTAAAGIQELDRHDLDVPGDARHAGAVVADGGNGPGDVGPVAVVVHRIGVVGHKIVSVDAARAGPHVRGQFGVVVIHARVDDGHDDTTAARGHIPGVGHVDVRA